MKRKKNFFWEYLIVVMLVLVYYVISYYPVYKNFQNAPSDRYYLGSIDYPIDMLGNLATIREGYMGHWQRSPKATSTIEGKDTFVKIEYILIGQISRMFKVEPLTAYHVSIFVLSLTLILLVYKIIIELTDTRLKRIVAFSLVLFATSIIVPIKGGGDIVYQLPGDALVFERLASTAPHYLLSGLLGLSALYFLAKFIDSPEDKKSILVSSILGFISTFIYAPIMVFFVSAFPIFIILKFVSNNIAKKDKKMLINMSIKLLIYGFVVLLPVLYSRWAFQFWDLNALSKTEKIVPFGIKLNDYILAVGLTYIFSLLSIPTILRKGKSLLLFFGALLMAHPVSIFVVASVLGINKLRYFLTPYYVIFAILATVGIYAITNFLPRQNNIFRNLIVVSLTMVIFLSSSLTYDYSTYFSHVCFCNQANFDYGYPKKETMKAIFWLRDNTKETDTVLTDTYVGMLIPAFSGNKVYTSWWFRLEDPTNFYRAEEPLGRFFANSMTDDKAESFIRSQKIKYVFFGEQEKSYANGEELKYIFLIPKIRTGNTIIYQVSS